MKDIRLVLGMALAACTASADSAFTPGQTAVMAYMKATVINPASYSPVRWGVEKPYTRRDSARWMAMKEAEAAVVLTKKQLEYFYSYNSAVKSKSIDTAVFRKAFVATKAKASQHSNRSDLLSIVTDTSVVGIVVAHTYRVKNKLGAIVLDSAQFVVWKNGAVTRR